MLPRRFCWPAILLIALSSAGSMPGLEKGKTITSYGHAVWQSDNGLPQNTIHKILQSKQGYLWFATEGGVVRFDGTNFTTFDKQNTPQLRSDYIRDLLEDASGTIWIGTSDGLTRLRGAQFKTYTTSDGLPSNNISSVQQFTQKSGALWVVTSAGLTSIENDRIQNVTSGDGLPLEVITPLVEGNDGALWAGTSSGLARIDNGRVTRYAGHLDIVALASDAKGNIWIGSKSGVALFEGKDFSAPAPLRQADLAGIQGLFCDRADRLWIATAKGTRVFDHDRLSSYGVADGLPSEQVTSIFEDREGSIWAGTARGIARFDGGRFSAYTPGNGFSGNIVTTIFEDREGSLWIGTESGGVNLLHDQKFTTYTVQDGLSDDAISSVFQDRSGVTWIGSNGNGLNKLVSSGTSRPKVTSYTTANGLPSNVILSLADDRKGDLWIGTPDGLTQFHDGRFKVFTAADGLADDFVRSILGARDGALWIGTRHGVSVYRNGHFDLYTTLDGLADNFVGALLEDQHSGIWIGTLGGLSHFDDGKFSNYTVQSGLSSNAITALYQDAEGDLWIGTNGGGLNLLHDGKLSHFHLNDPRFLPDVVLGILEDAQHNLWISSRKGIVRIARDDLLAASSNPSHPLSANWYGTADGMKIRECSSGGHPSSWRAKDGTLWFATLKGVATVDPEHMYVNHIKPEVVIEQVLVDDRTIDESIEQSIAPDLKEAEIKPGMARLAFHYAGLSFVAPQQVRYRYRLEGFDKDWIDAGTRRDAFYTNLPSGHYRFNVRAANGDGVWSDDAASFGFYLKPHFYRTYWFYALCACCAALLAWQIYRIRLRRMQTHFDLVLAERTRIAREIHDTLAQDFVGISVQLELITRMLTFSVEAAKEQLDQARILVRNSLGNARRSVWALRAPSLEKGDLPSALAEEAKKCLAQSGIKASLDVQGAYRPLSSVVEDHALRIAQEAINNAVRHANPSTISIRLAYAAKLFRLSVEDNGNGYSGEKIPSHDGGHFGIIGMNERAKQMGGTLTIHSAPGKGTEIIVEVPITRSVQGTAR